MRKSFWLFSILCCFIFCSCKNHKQPSKIKTDKSITKQTSFNNLFIDSNKINGFLASNTQYQKFQQQYSDFYKQRNFECAWFDTSGIAEQAYNFMNLVGNAVNTYNDSSLYNKTLVKEVNAFKQDSANKTITTSPDIIQTELTLTGEFFKYASKIYGGADINIEELGWFIPRKKLDLSVLLDSMIANKNDIANASIPLNNAYKKLLDFLPEYNKLNDESWDSIAYPEKALHAKSTSSIIPIVKERLYELGDLADNDSTNIYDTALLHAAKKFQRRMGQTPDGIIGRTFLKQLNITPAWRLQQILVNLERLRWLPETNDSSSHIVVNIPDYKMYVFDSGRLQFDMNVVVGATATNTVIFTGNLKYIVFSPYWNVPVSIIKKEILPGMQNDKNYLANHHMEIYGKNAGGLPAVRQLPGPDNALGNVKFLFPNNFDIYFHDTNNRGAFNASSRSLSHGCIRLSEPKKLAQYLLHYDTITYSNHNIDSFMNLTKEKWVTLKKSVPVMITYYTAFVDSSGRLNFRNDIYGHDSAMAVKLFAANSIKK